MAGRAKGTVAAATNGGRPQEPRYTRTPEFVAWVRALGDAKGRELVEELGRAVDLFRKKEYRSLFVRVMGLGQEARLILDGADILPVKAGEPCPDERRCFAAADPATGAVLAAILEALEIEAPRQPQEVVPIVAAAGAG